MSRKVSSAYRKLQPLLGSSNGAGGGSAAAGVSDHGLLAGLNNDDHPQYLTQSRADLRYLQALTFGNHDILSYHTVDGDAGQVVGVESTDTLGLLTPVSNARDNPAQILKSDLLGRLMVLTLYADNIEILNGGDLDMDDAGSGGNIIMAANATVDGVDLSAPGDGIEIIGDSYTADVGDGLELSGGEIVADLGDGLRFVSAEIAVTTDVARKNINNYFTDGQNVLGDVEVTGQVTASTDIVADRYVKADTSAIFGGTGVPTDTLDVDGTANISGAVEFSHWEIDSEGVLKSTDPAFAAGALGQGAGTYLSPEGHLEAYDLVLRGGLSAPVLAFKEVTVHGGADDWSPGGGAVTSGDATISGGSVTLRVKDDTRIGASRFLVGYKLHLVGYGGYTQASYTGYSMSPAYDIGAVALPREWVLTVNVWVIVTSTSYNESEGHYDYECDVIGGTAPDGSVIRAGTAMISYLDPTTVPYTLGGLRAIANDAFSPRFESYVIGDEPENGEIYRRIMLGRLDASPLVDSREHGLLAGPNLDNAASAYIKVDSSEVEMLGGTFRLNDSNGNTAVLIDPDAGMNIYVGAESTNALNYIIDATSEEIGEISVGGLIDVDTELDEDRGLPKRTATPNYIPTLSLFSRYHEGGIELEGRAIDLYDSEEASAITTEPGSRVAIEALSPLSVDYDDEGSSRLILETRPGTTFGRPYETSARIYADVASFYAGDSLSLRGGGAVVSLENGVVSLGGGVNMYELPTSSGGLAVGRIYNDSGTLKVVQ